jgi:VanZ family protein
VITTFLVRHSWITTVALVTTLAIGPAVGYWLVVRPRLATWLGLASLLPVAALTLAPTSRDLATGCATEWNIPTFGAVEQMANVVLFVPPVLLFGVAVRKLGLVCLGAIVASGLIETTQAFVTALGRSCSTNDWLANTLGSALGGAVAALVLWVRRPGTGDRRAIGEGRGSAAR